MTGNFESIMAFFFYTFIFLFVISCYLDFICNLSVKKFISVITFLANLGTYLHHIIFHIYLAGLKMKMMTLS